VKTLKSFSMCVIHKHATFILMRVDIFFKFLSIMSIFIYFANLIARRVRIKKNLRPARFGATGESSVTIVTTCLRRLITNPLNSNTLLFDLDRGDS